MSHLKTKHSKKYEEVRQKTEERKQICKQTSSNQRKFQLASQATLPGIAAKKAKLESSSVLKKITRKVAGMIIHDFQPYSFVEDKGFKGLMQQL